MKTKNMNSNFLAMTIKTHQALFVIILVAVLQISVYGNLAENPSMEGNFIFQDPIGNVAEDWTGWFLPDPMNWYQVPGNLSEGSTGLTGSKSQCIEWNGQRYEYSDGHYGIYQQIDSLQVGKVYKVSSWFKGRLDIWPIHMPGEARLSFYGEIGVGLNGGADPNLATNWQETFVWPWPFYDSYETPWYNVYTYFSSLGNTATIFVGIRRAHGYAYNEYYDSDLGVWLIRNEPWLLSCYIDDVVVEPVEIGAGSTVEATSPIPANGVSYSEVTITLVDANGDPLANIPASEIVVDCTGSGNTIIGPESPTDANGQTTARITSTVAETKTVSVTVLGTLLGDTAVVEFVGESFGPIWYVDDDATGADDGSSWADAFNHLQNALTAAQSGHEIHVTQGNYKPDRGLWVTKGSRYETFQLLNNVVVFGGFPSGGADWSDRNPDMYETILSGDLNENDVQLENPSELLEEPTRADNSYHVVTGSRTDANAIIDGFTVTAGNANGEESPHNYGGGMLNDINSNPTVSNCNFVANSASYCGGAIVSDADSSPTVTNCTFTGNSADYSGGMHIDAGSTSVVTNCKFTNNWANLYGGGLLNYEGTPDLVNCTFTGNSAEWGAGIFNWYNASPMLTNCVFNANSADYGAGIFNWDNSSPTLTNCTFTDNSAEVGGGGMGCGMESSPMMTNCTFTGNSAEWGGGMYNYDISCPTLINCTFTGNLAEFGGGMGNYESSPTVTNCTFSGNLASAGGGIQNYESSLTIGNCILWGNTASSDGNEIALMNSSAIDIDYCDLQGGEAEIYIDETSSINLGSGNIDADPLFVEIGYWDPNDTPEIEMDDFWVEGDYHLRWTSPCINTGDPNFVGEEGEVDIDGEPRVMGGRVDMGADEVGEKQADFTRDGRIDVSDLSVLSGAWDTMEGEGNWYVLSDLFEDGVIGLDDLAMFVDDWLWIADGAN